MNFTNSNARWKFRKAISKGMAVALSAAMVAGSISVDTLTVFAEENETTVESTVQETTETKAETVEETKEEGSEESTEETIESEAEESTATESEAETETETETLEESGEAKDETVAAPEKAKTIAVAAQQTDAEKTYQDFVEDEQVGDFKFGTDVTKDSTYSSETGYGFSKVEYPSEAKGWSGNVYYPREVAVTAGDSSYVENAEGALAIKSKVWTETESTGYGVYTYENTATFDYDLPAADYKVEVTFVNPTGSSYNAYVEAEDITKSSNIDVAAGSSNTVSFTACLVKGNLNLKFLGTSAATSESAATEQTVYVSEVKITRLATNAAREDGKPTVFIASDSTVQSYDSYYNPQTGWGQVLAKFFGDGEYEEVTSETANYSQSKTYETSNAVVENRAIGGRSSSSFVQEGKLDDLLEDVRPGDYLLIQWGHNDSTYSRPNRYVSSTEFANWIQYYIDGAIQRGATPILVTPVARYSYTTDSEGNLISYASNFEAYRQVMIKMSQEQGVALVDLTQRSIDVANSFGIDGGKSLWLYTNAGDYTGAYAGGSTDSTHLQWYGAYKFAQCVASGIVEAGNSSVYTNENNASDANKEALQNLAKLIDLRAATTAPGD